MYMKSQIKKLLNEKVNKLLLLEELSLLIEKELAVGTALTNKLEKIDKEYAKTLLDFLKSNKISDNVTIDSIDYTSDDDKTLTGYFKDREGKTKARKFKVGKLLDYIGIGVDRFKGYELQDLISNLKKGSLKEELEFRVFDGDDILWAYHCDNYYDDETMGSCMRHQSAQKYLSMYTDNPGSVKCLVLLHKEDGDEKVMGRALLWTMDNGKIYMDRIYTADNGASDYLFYKYSEKNGINSSYHNGDDPTSYVTLEYDDRYEYYPYMDTFKYYNVNTGELSAFFPDYALEDDNVITLQSFDGGYTSSVRFKYGKSAGEYIQYDSDIDALVDAKLLDYKVDGEHIKGYASIDDVIELYDGETVLEKDARRLISSKYVDLKNKGYRGNQNIYQYGFKDDVVQLNPDFYEENVHAYFEDVAKVVKQPNGEEFWVLEDDVEDFEDYLYENINTKSTVKKLLREELLKEKLTDVNSDVDFLYDKYFKSDIDEIARTGIVTRSLFEKGNTNTMALSSDASNKANETNACVIQVNYGNKGINGNFYSPSTSMISISINDDAVRHSLEYGGDIKKAKSVLTPLLQKSFSKEFTEEKIKGSIHHELVHWVDDTMNNKHIAKIVDNKPEDFNSHYVEIQAQIHNIVQLKRKYADIWDLMSFDEMFHMSPTLINVYKDLKPENKKKWLIKLKRRMYREGLLGDEMR